MQKPIRLLAAISACLLPHAMSADLVLVEDGQSRMPIVIFADAPPLTRQAADELALYIEKTSGARPEVLEGQPDPLPASAIWVGVQPVLDDLFPGLDFDFQHPEEILIAANARHLVIAGRDRWDPDHLNVDVGRGELEGYQFEYGTHNAVYTFLHDRLGVRWLWPGELGEDILRRETIAFAPFEYRYHPQVRYRGGLLAYSQLSRSGSVHGPDHPGVTRGGVVSHFWLRAQRLQLGSLPAPGGGGGGWGRWWGRFREIHPAFFALQPDGSRGGGDRPFPSEGNVKMCHSNPALWRQWLEDVEAELDQNPTQRVFNAAPGDGWTSGHCICEDCRAWDHPDGEPRRLQWQGLNQTYVALSDRDVTFANQVARLLKQRFPDKDLYVYTYAYGHSRPPPVAAVPDDNVIIGNVANFLLKSDGVDRGSFVEQRRHRDNFAGWGRVTKNHFWRPNTGSPVGFQWGMPDVPLRRTIADMRFVAEHGMAGIYVDYIREFWATQGPLYYLMAQMIWDPSRDGEAILADYYRRAFGPAAREMEAYWNYMDRIREECFGTQDPTHADHDILDFYNAERLDPAAAMLEAAKAALGAGDDRYRERIAFVEAGLTFTRLFAENGRLMRRVDNQEDPDGTARARAMDNWARIWAVRQAFPGAMRWRVIFGGSRGNGPPAQFDPGFDPRAL